MTCQRNGVISVDALSAARMHAAEEEYVYLRSPLRPPAISEAGAAIAETNLDHVDQQPE